MFQDRDVAWKVLDGPFGKETDGSLRQKDRIAAFSTWPRTAGSAAFSQQRPGDSGRAADMKGLKIRVMPNPAHQETVKALGALAGDGWLAASSIRPLRTKVADGAGKRRSHIPGAQAARGPEIYDPGWSFLQHQQRHYPGQVV